MVVSGEREATPRQGVHDMLAESSRPNINFMRAPALLRLPPSVATEGPQLSLVPATLHRGRCEQSDTVAGYEYK